MVILAIHRIRPFGHKGDWIITYCTASPVATTANNRLQLFSGGWPAAQGTQPEMLNDDYVKFIRFAMADYADAVTACWALSPIMVI